MPTDPLNAAAMIQALRGQPEGMPQDNPFPAPQRQPNELEALLRQADALRKSIPVGFKGKKGGGIITVKGTF